MASMGTSIVIADPCPVFVRGLMNVLHSAHTFELLRRNEISSSDTGPVSEHSIARQLDAGRLWDRNPGNSEFGTMPDPNTPHGYS